MGSRTIRRKEEGKEVGVVRNYLSGALRVVLVAALVALQSAVIILLSLWLNSYSVYMYLLIEVLSICIIIGLVNDNRCPSYKISWICVILLLPLSGHIMYALWGMPGTMRKPERYMLEQMKRGEQYLEYQKETVEAFSKEYPTKTRMVRFLEDAHFPLYRNNEIAYYPMGTETFEAIFEDIRKATRFILISFFIVGEGSLWQRMHQLLLEKIAEGVEVKFLYDDFGTMLRTPKNFRKSLESEGFEIRVFNPIHQYTDKLYMNYRSHQKIVVIDGECGYTGGMNLADEYVNLVERFGVWKDNAVRISGDAVWGLTVVFLQMWEASEKKAPVDYLRYRAEHSFPKNNIYCQVVADGPANHPSNPIVSLYRQIIYYAKKKLYITTPYLVIENDMQEALVLAAKSGVDVRIVTPAIPDKRWVKLLTDYHYGPLLEAGVRIYEYMPGFIHAKTIVNEDCGVVGTINMDYRSFYLHYECGVFLCNRESVGVIHQDLEETMKISREITYEEWKACPLRIRLQQRILNLFAPLM